MCGGMPSAFVPNLRILWSLGPVRGAELGTNPETPSELTALLDRESDNAVVPWPLQRKISCGMFWLWVHSSLPSCPDLAHRHANRLVKQPPARQPLAIEKRRGHSVNSYKPSQLRTVLLGPIGLVAMLLLSTPSCKAQEVSPDHFTATGVQDVYENAPAKVATPNSQQKLPDSKTRRHKMSSPGMPQASPKRTSLLHAQPGRQVVSKKHKSAPIASTKH